jgi:hypothetical protein
MKRSWSYAFLVGLLFWLFLPYAQASDAVNSVPVNVVNPLVGWEAQVKDFGSLAIVVLVVRWFMGHIEAKDKAFLEAISAFMLALKVKDDKYTELANACRSEHHASTARVLAHLDMLKNSE